MGWGGVGGIDLISVNKFLERRSRAVKEDPELSVRPDGGRTSEQMGLESLSAPPGIEPSPKPPPIGARELRTAKSSPAHRRPWNLPGQPNPGRGSDST